MDSDELVVNVEGGAPSPAASSESLSTEDYALWNNDQSLNYSVPIGNPKCSSKGQSCELGYFTVQLVS